MLYDNALLILAYCQAYSITRRRLYLLTAERTADFVLREMTAPEGGFFSAQDADSDGEEGKYYLFTPGELVRLLGAERGGAFNRHFDITEAGNFEGKSIPNLLHSEPDLGRSVGNGLSVPQKPLFPPAGRQDSHCLERSHDRSAVPSVSGRRKPNVSGRCETGGPFSMGKPLER